MKIMNLLDVDAIAETKVTAKNIFPIMLQYFMEDSQNYIFTIRQGIDANNMEPIVVVSHTLKSSARQMGAMYMSDIAKCIESLAREQSSSGKSDMAPITQLLVELETIFIQTKEAYRTHAI